MALSIGAVAGVATVIVAIVIWQAQERQQALITALARAHLVELCKDLGEHVTEWEEALRDAVASNDADRFNRFRASVEAFRAHVDPIHATQSDVQYFAEGQRFQGPLEPMLAELDPYPECAAVIQAVRDFQATALDFKTGIVASLGEMIAGEGPWSAGHQNDPVAFKTKKDELFAEVQNAHRTVMVAIRDFTATAA